MLVVRKGKSVDPYPAYLKKHNFEYTIFQTVGHFIIVFHEMKSRFYIAIKYFEINVS